MPSYSEQDAARIAAALNGLGHIAMGHSLEEIRRSKGDTKLREDFHEDATVVLELVAHESKRKSPAIRCPEECEAALSRFRDMVRAIDFDDAVSMASLKTYARQVLAAFGVPLPE
ncbi:hypothetical protein [Archangium sp.]|jgi:hypothetical protein|uniref:hypothetical protein n=1 Tax=Archangium sp. TaxID=1872627 RepID=UPI002ED7E7D0